MLLKHIKLFILPFVAVMTLAACQDQPQQTNAQPSQAPSVSVAEVVAQRIIEWDEFTGRLQSPEHVELRTRVSGPVAEVLFEEGSDVKAGDTLIKIDDQTFKAEVSGLQAQLDSANTQLSLAESELKRAEALFKRKAISTEILDNRKADQQRALALVKNARAALNLARLNLGFTAVKAPIDGRISRVLTTKGNHVEAGSTVVTTLVATNPIFALFDMDEATFLDFAKRIQSTDSKDRPIVFMGLVNDQGYPHQGRLNFVDNQINVETGTILTRAVFTNDQGLFLPGMFARMRLPGSEPFDGILINERAVGTDFNKKFVLVLDEKNTVQYRPITLGEKVSGLRIVTSGLAQGEKIVVDGLQRVRPGTPVTPEEVPMATSEMLAELKINQLAFAPKQSGVKPETIASAEAITPEDAKQAKTTVQ